MFCLFYLLQGSAPATVHQTSMEMPAFPSPTPRYLTVTSAKIVHFTLRKRTPISHSHHYPHHPAKQRNSPLMSSPPYLHLTQVFIPGTEVEGARRVRKCFNVKLFELECLTLYKQINDVRRRMLIIIDVSPKVS